MNPLAHNPFELADRAGLWVASKMIAFGYRNLSIHPVGARQVPRWLFVGLALAIPFFDPSRAKGFLPFLLIFVVVSAMRFIRDLPAIRKQWDAELYRTYGAKALHERESLTFRAILLVVTIFLLVSPVPGASESLKVPYALSAMQIITLMLLQWIEAAELPEPDDGDFFAKPQGN